MEKIFQNKLFVLTVLLLILVGGVFYWFAYRPARIRHDCSWVKQISPAMPAEAAITKEDADASQREYNECLGRYPAPIEKQGFDLSAFPGSAIDALNAKYKCDGLLKQERPAAPAKPETEWYREAREKEYDFCIHEKGLLR